MDGRRIDNTVHMLRDFVQLANTENLESAFIFSTALTMRTNVCAVFIRYLYIGYARSIPMRPQGSKSTGSLVPTYSVDVAYGRGALAAPFFTSFSLKYLLCNFRRIPILSVLLRAGKKSSVCIMLTMQ